MSPTTRRGFIRNATLGATGLPFALGSAAHSVANSTVKPNIVFILADDLGYADLGCYGQKEIATPNLDRMAAEGMRFTQAYSGSPVCAPSRCCLLTGKHNGHGRVRDNIPHGVFLQPDDVTVAEVLKGAGYRTGAIGKWSLGNPGSWGVANYQGFDHFYGHLNQDQAHFYYPDYLWRNDEIELLRGNRGGQRGDYTHDLFTEEALAFIRDNSRHPFFLYLAYTLPHWSDYDGDSPDSLPVPTDEPYTDRDWPQVEKNYAAMVARMDRDVGRILDLVKELGLDSNTLVIFTSDNGPSAEKSHDIEFFDSNGVLRGAKREVYEGGIRVPLIARWPGRVPAGSQSEHLCAFWDVLPTCAELAGLPPAAGVDGLSFVPTLLGEAERQIEHEYLYWDYGHTRDIFHQAIRCRNWKGVRNGVDSPLELYDLASDPGETENLAERHPETVAEIERMMKEAFVPSPDYPLGGSEGT
jgi:arylsulfatase A-like enzyme